MISFIGRLRVCACKRIHKINPTPSPHAPVNVSGLTVGQLIVALFGVARAQNPALTERWIRVSHRAGSKLPRSTLAVSIQRLGEVDLVCRALETELATIPAAEGAMDFRFHYLMLLSEWWISSAYAVCYTLRDRKMMSDEAFVRLADDLRLVRVQNEKFELPSDRKMSTPLQMIPTQLRADETEAPIYEYDKNDPLRAHIPRRGLSARHSAMWEVIDVTTQSDRWHERLELSDRMIELLDLPINSDQTPSSPDPKSAD